MNSMKPWLLFLCCFNSTIFISFRHVWQLTKYDATAWAPGVCKVDAKWDWSGSVSNSPSTATLARTMVLLCPMHIQLNISAKTNAHLKAVRVKARVMSTTVVVIQLILIPEFSLVYFSPTLHWQKNKEQFLQLQVVIFKYVFFSIQKHTYKSYFVRSHPDHRIDNNSAPCANGDIAAHRHRISGYKIGKLDVLKIK